MNTQNQNDATTSTQSTQVKLSERLTPLVRQAVVLKANDKKGADALRNQLFALRNDLDQNEKIVLGNRLMALTVGGKLPMQAFRILSPRFQEPITASAFRLVIKFTGLDAGHLTLKDAARLVEAARKNGNLTDEVKKAVNTLDAYANRRGIYAFDYSDKKRARKGIEAALDAALSDIDVSGSFDGENNDIEDQVTELEAQLVTAKAAKVKAAEGDDDEADEALATASAEVKRITAELAELRQQMETAEVSEAVASAEAEQMPAFPVEDDENDLEDQVAELVEKLEELEAQLVTAKAAKVKAAEGDDDEADEALATASAEVKRISGELVELRQQMTDAKALTSAITNVVEATLVETTTTAPAVLQPEVVVVAEKALEAMTYVARFQARGEKYPAFFDIARRADNGDPPSVGAAKKILGLK